MDKVELADECCARILQAMKQPAPQMDWITAAKKPTPVVCVPCGRAGGPHHPPPPLLVDIECDLVWKPPNWPWHSVAQHWGKVAWAAYVEPHLVLGAWQHNQRMLTMTAVTTSSQPCSDPTRTATSSRGPEPAQPGPPDAHPAANLPTAQPTAASSPPFAQATAAGGSVQPGDRQEDEALPYVAPEPACPGTVYGSLLEAWELQQELLSGRRKPPRKVLIGGSHNILGLLAAPAANVDLHSRLDASMVPVICMDHVRTAASPQPPCPFLVRIRDNNIEEVLYKNPRIQWGRLLQGWQAVERIGQLTSGGQLVLGLRAASSGSAAPGPAPALPLPDPCHHQGQGAQQASSPGEAPETVAAPPAAPAAQPFGPEPLNGLQGVPAQDPSPMEEELTAEALVAKAGPGADPLPNVDWGDALRTCTKRIYKSKPRWPLRVAQGSHKRLSTWVKSKGLQLTGQCKVHREPVVAGPHLLVLEVKPLAQAVAPTCQPPAGQYWFLKGGAVEQSVGDVLCSDGSLNGAGPSQPGAVPAPAAGGAAGRGSGSERKRTAAGIGQAEGKRPRGSDAPEPGLAAGVAAPGGATAGGSLGTAEEGGPGPSPAAAGMGGAPYEADPVVPLTAAAPSHAGMAGSYGQGVTDPMASIQEEPGGSGIASWQLPLFTVHLQAASPSATCTSLTCMLLLLLLLPVLAMAVDRGRAVLAQRDTSQVLVTSIVLKPNVTLVDIISTRMMGQYSFLATVFEAFRVHKLSVDVVAISEVSVSLTLDPKKLPDIESELGQLKLDLDKIATVSYRRNLAIVSLICNVQRTSRILENVFDVLDSCGINVVMMSQGASKTDISLVVEGADGQKAVLALHKRFFEDSSHV
ncbi:hypothetical protein QJQ45_004789 [Haematococcus lacustris]|nr:hypothetical protein QJQ45_004789 [Haematococcus lacustris]